MKKRSLPVLLLLCGTVAISCAENGYDLSGKDVFTKGFPQFLSFRGEMVRASHKDYVSWCESVRGASGVIRKFIPEELPKLYPESTGWAGRYAAENPAAVVLLHLNGEARQVLGFPDVHERYFPGHWVHLPGTGLTASVEPGDTELKVQDARPFKTKAYVNRERDGSKSWFPHHIILVPLDAGGNRLWYESEYAIIQNVDYKKNMLTVERGQIFSKARTFKAEQTYVAPLAAGVWGGAPMWFYNLSSACPADSNGCSAADVFVREIAGWFAPGGSLGRFNGVAFDVNYWKVRDELWDTNNDGQSDAGLVAGRNIWREGDWAFLRNLRRALGDDRLITCDGQHMENQQAVGVLDGIESEGLVQHNDGFRGFSRTVNTHLYWQQNNTRKHDFRYVVLKLMDKNDEARSDQLRRFGTGTACCLGAFVTGSSAPFLPEGFSRPGSLGFPAGELIRPAQRSPDLLGASDLLKQLHGEGCSIRPENGRLLIAAEPDTDPSKPMTVMLKNMKVPPGDLTVFVTMESLDPLEGFTPDDRVPRLVQAEFLKTPDYGEGRRVNEFYTDLYGYTGTRGPSVMSFYLRRPGLGAETMDIRFKIEGRGRAVLHTITAHSAPDVLIRVFDHGIVAVNPALEPVAIPFTELLPGLSGLPVSLTVPSLDAQFIAR
jgi:hypothetical protein